MATRAATFSAKIKNLKDFQTRIVRGVSPVPSGVDIANTLKYFSQTLLGVLKEVPVRNSAIFEPKQRDAFGLSLFPNLSYYDLYVAVTGIINSVQLIQTSQHALGESVLHVIGCLVPFLELEVLETLPYTVASTLASFPTSLHKDIILLLSTNVLSIHLGHGTRNDRKSFVMESIPAILMLVFQYVSNDDYHAMILECLMSLKRNVCKDLLCVIAYGPPCVRSPAVSRLFFYFPQLLPSPEYKEGATHKFTAWVAPMCQGENCCAVGVNVAVKKCLDWFITAAYSDQPHPLYLCADCAKAVDNRYSKFLIDVLQPVVDVSLICELKNCQSVNRQAICMCFSFECTCVNEFRPIRLCEDCHKRQHTFHDDHIFQQSIQCMWSCEKETQGYLIDAITSLLKEAQPIDEKGTVDVSDDQMLLQSQLDIDEEEEEKSVESQTTDTRLLSRYGIWLLIELTPFNESVSVDILSRLLSVLFQWFEATAYLPDDAVGTSLDKLKMEFISNWLSKVNWMYYEVIVSCLLPHPPCYSRIGSCWDTLSNRALQIREDLNRFICLVPYGIINFQVWDYVMMYWLEALRTEVTGYDRNELEVPLCKVFDNELSPLCFDTSQVYRFISSRFELSSVLQEQSLQWLHIMTSLEVFIPVQLLLQTFHSGIEVITCDASDSCNLHDDRKIDRKTEIANEVSLKPEQLNLKCFIIMLDVLLQQVKIQNIEGHAGSDNDICRQLMSLLSKMLNWTCSTRQMEGSIKTAHVEESENSSDSGDMRMLWYQFTVRTLQFLAPKDEINIPVEELLLLETASSVTHDNNTGVCKELFDVISSDDLSHLPSHFQLLWALLQDLRNLNDTDLLHLNLTCLKLLLIHVNCFQQSPESVHKKFIEYCVAQQLIPMLWKLLMEEHFSIACMCVPLLCLSLTQPSGDSVFWKIIEEDFNKEDWTVRFQASEKTAVIARLITSKQIDHNQRIKNSLAHAFCYLIGSLDDVKSVVVQRTAHYLGTINASSIKCMCQCLEFQFDTVIGDRTMILHKLYLLSVLLSDSKILSWEFFLDRFDTLCLEAQLELEHTEDVSQIQDLYNNAHDGETFQRKVSRAKLTLSETSGVRAISNTFYLKTTQRRAVSDVVASLHTNNQQSSSTKVDQSRYESSPNQRIVSQFRSRGSRIGVTMFTNYIFPVGGNLREFTDGESNFAALLQRAMDLDKADRHTLYHIVTLLMKFMINCRIDVLHDDLITSRVQNIVLRHVYVLLGYNQNEKAFNVPPYKLRCSVVFNAFISGMAKVLDHNFALGCIILPVSLAILQYSPSPQRYASDYQPPTYSLWFLDQQTRQSWLMSLLVILYKYQYNSSATSSIIHTLICITINTIRCQKHYCKKQDDTLEPSSPFIHRNRDTSNVSVGDLENIIETETPPQSPAVLSPQRDAEDSNHNVWVPCSHGHIPVLDQDEVTWSESVKHLSLNPSLSLEDLYPTNCRSTTELAKPSETEDMTIMASGFPLCGVRDSLKGFRHSCQNTKGLSPTETFVQLSQKQVKRIAEYNKSFTHDNALELKSENLDEIRSSVDNLNQKTEIISTSFESEMNLTGIMKDQCNILNNESQQSCTQPFMPSKRVIGQTDKSQCSDVLCDVKFSGNRFPVNVDRLNAVCETPVMSPVESPTKVDGFSSYEYCSKTDDAILSITSPLDSNISVHVEGNTVESLCSSPLQSVGLAVKPNFRQRRKTGLNTVIEIQKSMTESADLSIIQLSPIPRRPRRVDIIDKSQQQHQQQQHQPKQRSVAGSAATTTAANGNGNNSSGSHSTDYFLVDHCPHCNAVIESYDEDTISLSIVCLATFIHREPALAAPLLLDIIKSVTTIASSSPYPWQSELSGAIIPGNSISVARQFIRCVLHQLAQNNILLQLFMSDLSGTDCLKTISAALLDFSDLNSFAALQILLDAVNEMKNFTHEQLTNVLNNLATYIDCIVLDSSSPIWMNILAQLEVFFRKLPAQLHGTDEDMCPVLNIMISVKSARPHSCEGYSGTIFKTS